MASALRRAATSPLLGPSYASFSSSTHASACTLRPHRMLTSLPPCAGAIANFSAMPSFARWMLTCPQRALNRTARMLLLLDAQPLPQVHLADRLARPEAEQIERQRGGRATTERQRPRQPVKPLSGNPR